MSDDVIANMRARVEQCRRLAKHITDQRAAETLRKMADEVEADIVLLECRADTLVERRGQTSNR